MRAMLSKWIRFRHLQAAGAIALLALASACTADHLARREGVTMEGGNAKAVNMVQTAVDTMPASARRTTLSADGKRMSVALERYRNPVDPDQATDSSSAKIEASSPSQE
jgi:hypothetical protein